jgi:PAS domain S-box-containing protein
MTLSARTGLAMVMLVVMTATLVCISTYRSVEAVIVPRSQERIESHLRLLARDVDVHLHGPRADLLALREAVTLRNIMRARLDGTSGLIDGRTESAWRRLLGERFALQLRTRPEYRQLAFVGAADGAREIVRADRGPDGTIRILGEDQLQPPGDRDEIQAVLQALPGHIRVTPLGTGDRATDWQHRPVMRVATPIHSPDGNTFGTLLIDIDMQEVFARLAAAAWPGGRIAVVDGQDRYLFDGGSEGEAAVGRRLRDDFPDLAVASRSEDVSFQIATARSGEQFGLALVPVLAAAEAGVALVEAVPYATMTQPAVVAGQSIIRAALASVLAAVALAIAFARSLTRPLGQMTQAIEAFGRNEPVTLPTTASGEIGVLARAFDRMISDLKTQAQAAEKFRLAVETSPSGMLMVDTAGCIVLVNEAIERQFLYDREELIGQPVDRLLPHRLRRQHAEHRAAYAASPDARPMGAGRELVGLRRDGSEFPVEVELNPIHTTDGLLVLGVVVDIAERRAAEEMFRLAVEACPSGMMIVDEYGRIVMVNREIERLFGYERGELIDHGVEMLVPESARMRHRHLREEFATWPETRNIGSGRDLFGVHKDGTEIAVEIGLNPVHIGEELLVLCVVVDISMRKRTERLKDEFVATVSHELRTPLTSIAASLGLLAGNPALGLPEPAKRLVTIAHSNSQRLMRLINDILDIEKIESGKVIFDLKRIELRPLVEQAIEASRGLADAHRVRLTIAEPAPAVAVKADADRLTQVMVNLISNAIKFSPPNGEVAISIAHEGSRARIAVRDHGSGIPPEFRARIFEKFAQADNSDSRQKGGTGLGLSIVKQIVGRLDGEVGFEDAPGGGTIFHVDLPDWETASRGDAVAGSDGGARLLICDDEPGLARVLAHKLGKVGFACDIAMSGADVISKASAGGYAAILLDLQLPDCDGVSLIQELRGQPQNRDTPIIVISSDPERGRDDIRSASLQVLDWFEKPVDMARLAAVLERPGIHAGGRRPRILHVDDDRDTLATVAQAMAPHADVTSVDSIAAARQALSEASFDLAAIDMAMTDGGGLDLISDLRDRDGVAIPVIMFSGRDANPASAAQMHAALTSRATSVQDLVATLRKRVAAAGVNPAKLKETA